MLEPSQEIFFFQHFFFFFDVDHFLKVFTDFVTILLLQNIVYILVFFGYEAHGILAPGPGIKLTPSFGRQNLNHWAARKVPVMYVQPVLWVILN